MLCRLVYSVGLRVKPLPVERGRVRVRDICKQALSSEVLGHVHLTLACPSVQLLGSSGTILLACTD